MPTSKTQIDKLGDRLRAGSVQDQDLRDLDEYRRSFGSAYDHVLAVLHERFGLAVAPTGRPAKSTSSILEKLRRESIRLSQLQDIAGCRMVVPNVDDQEVSVRVLRDLFPSADIDDRRDRPSHGYRAVHVIVNVGGKLVEIQVRTVLQDLWAHVSERFSDVVDSRIKYGGGPESIRRLLADESARVAQLEALLLQRPVLDMAHEWLKSISRLLELASDPLRWRE